MCEAAASCKDISPVTNWEPHSVTLVGYCLRREARGESSARNSVSCQSQRYGVTVRGNVTGVYPP